MEKWRKEIAETVAALVVCGMFVISVMLMILKVYPIA